MGTQISALCEGRWAVGLCYLKGDHEFVCCNNSNMNLCESSWCPLPLLPAGDTVLSWQKSGTSFPSRPSSVLECRRKMRREEETRSFSPVLFQAVLAVVYLFWEFSEPLKDQLSCRSHSIFASSLPICNFCSPWDFLSTFMLILWSCSLTLDLSLSLSLASWILSWNVMQWGKCSQFWESRGWGTETGSLWAAENFCGLLPGLGSTGSPRLSWGEELWLGSGMGYCKHRENPAAAESREAQGYIWLF